MCKNSHFSQKYHFRKKHTILAKMYLFSETSVSQFVKNGSKIDHYIPHFSQKYTQNYEKCQKYQVSKRAQNWLKNGQNHLLAIFSKMAKISKFPKNSHFLTTFNSLLDHQFVQTSPISYLQSVQSYSIHSNTHISTCLKNGHFFMAYPNSLKFPQISHFLHSFWPPRLPIFIHFLPK